MDDVYLFLTLSSVVCFVIGIIKPEVFSRFFGDDVTRGRAGIVFVLIAFIFYFQFGVATEDDRNAQQAKTSQQTMLADQMDPVVIGESKSAPGVVTEPTTEFTEAVTVAEEEVVRAEAYGVLSVVDGDTIKVNINGNTETLRLIGMDTPETVDPRKPVQCFGEEASKKAKEILNGKKVSLEADPSQGERDKYQRLLRYVYLEDGSSFNKRMIEEGYAHEYTYQSNPYKYQNEYKEAEARARTVKAGLWSDSACSGDTLQPAISAKPTITPAPSLVEESPNTPGAAWACNCSKTCANMSCSEAQYQLNSCGCSRRDGDGDGIACDSQCQ